MKNKGIILAILGILVLFFNLSRPVYAGLVILKVVVVSRLAVTEVLALLMVLQADFRVVSPVVQVRAVARQHLVETVIYSVLYFCLSCSMHLRKQAIMEK